MSSKTLTHKEHAVIFLFLFWCLYFLVGWRSNFPYFVNSSLPVKFKCFLYVWRSIVILAITILITNNNRITHATRKKLQNLLLPTTFYILIWSIQTLRSLLNQQLNSLSKDNKITKITKIIFSIYYLRKIDPISKLWTW